jgi:hypothetical protein
VNKEEQLTKYVVIPTLHHVGCSRIRYVHGTDEHGRDVVFFGRDRLGQESLYAAQVKLGIIPQLREGLRAPYKDPETGRTHRVNRMYLIILGNMVGTARNQIHSLLESAPNIVAVDRQTIDLLSDREGVATDIDSGVRRRSHRRDGPPRSPCAAHRPHPSPDAPPPLPRRTRGRHAPPHCC